VEQRERTRETGSWSSPSAAQPPRKGVVEEVNAEEPPRLRVRWDDGHTTGFSPAAQTCRIEQSKKES
jgi:hypothetical protein